MADDPGNRNRIVMDDSMRAGMHSLLEEDKFVDYKIIVEGREFKVHKLAMSSMSDYFKIMLSGDLAESKQDSVVIEGVGLSANVMEVLIQFIYTNKMDISEDNIADILGGAVYFQMKAAIKVCTQFLIDNLDPENWFDVFTLLESFSLSNAVEDVETYIRGNITDIAKADSKMKLQYWNMCFLVENWRSAEYDLFWFILKWVTAEEEERKQYTDQLLCSVRFALMNRLQLDAIRSSAMEFGGPSVLGLIDEALAYHRLPFHQRVLDDSEQSKVRSPPSFVNIVNTQYTPAEIGHFYDPVIEKQFVKHESLTSPTSYLIGPTFDCQKVVVNNFLIVHESTSAHQVKFHLFDPRAMQWERMADLQSPMLGATLVHDNQHLYVIGGLEPTEPLQLLSSVMRYDFESNSWSDFASLPYPPLFAAWCVYDNGLYASGGLTSAHVADAVEDGDQIDPNEIQSTLYRLDLATLQWETKAPMSVPEYAHKMHVMKVRGEDHLCIIDSEFHMEIYSPAHDFWSSIDLAFDKPLLEFEGHGMVESWFLGNEIFTLEYDSETGNVIYYQKITVPENGWIGRVEHIKHNGGHNICGIKHILAIAPPTSEPEFGRV